MKFFITYLPPGEFGPRELYGVIRESTELSIKNWVAFYLTREEAEKAYPGAVFI